MPMRSLLLTSAALFASVACSTAVSATWLQPRVPTAVAESGICAAFSVLSGDYTATAGSTNGYFGTPQPGERFTLTFSGSGVGSFRVVGDPSGVVTLAGPTSAPGSLTYTAGGTFPSGAVGIGFYFDSGEGSVTLQASCVSPTRPAPVLDARGLALLGGLLAIAGAMFARRLHRRERPRI